MALKPDRKYTDGTDISYFCNATAERGCVAIFLTGGSGAAMDQAEALVAVSGALGSASGKVPAGILLNDMVNLDLTRQHINWHQDEVQLGGKVTLLRHGVVVTNAISGTPTVGAPAYFTCTNDAYGSKVAMTRPYVLTPTLQDYAVAGGGANPAPSARVGTFLSTKDADGYAKVEINIL